MLKIEYDWFGGQSCGMIRFKRDGKYGYIDFAGKVAIEPKFEFYSEFSEDATITSDKDGFYFLDKKGSKLFAGKRFAEVSDFNEGLACVAEKGTEGKKGLVSATGEIVLEAVYDNIDDCDTAGIYIVQKKNLYGLYDKEGREIAKPKYEMIGGFSEEGLAAVCRKKKYGYIDTDGNFVIGIKYEKANKFYSGKAEV